MGRKVGRSNTLEYGLPRIADWPSMFIRPTAERALRAFPAPTWQTDAIRLEPQ